MLIRESKIKKHLIFYVSNFWRDINSSIFYFLYKLEKIIIFNKNLFDEILFLSYLRIKYFFGFNLKII